MKLIQAITQIRSCDQSFYIINIYSFTKLTMITSKSI